MGALLLLIDDSCHLKVRWVSFADPNSVHRSRRIIAPEIAGFCAFSHMHGNTCLLPKDLGRKCRSVDYAFKSRATVVISSMVLKVVALML